MIFKIQNGDLVSCSDEERNTAEEPTDWLLKLQDPNLVLGVRFGNGFGRPSHQIDAILLDLCRWPDEGYVRDVECSSLSCRRLVSCRDCLALSIFGVAKIQSIKHTPR